MIDFDAIANLKVLVVGDAILDEYNYVTPIGKSIKEDVISTKFENRKVFRGGVWAAAEHIRGLCACVHVRHGKKVTRNIRFLDPIYKRKLFTVHASDIGESSRHNTLDFYDLVVVTDFGHGLLGRALIEKLSVESKFLAVNAQTNSTNFGFNLITKYPRADFVVLDELEARLAVHDRDSPVEEVITKLGFKKIIVTQGAKGAIGYDGEFFSQGATADRVVDTMGAGDAFLAVSAPFAAIGASIEDLVRIGNAAGAEKVSIVGHSRPIRRQELEERLRA